MRHAVAWGEVLEDGTKSFYSHFGGMWSVWTSVGENVQSRESLCRNISRVWEAMFVDLGGGLGDGSRRCGVAYAEACSVLSVRMALGVK